MFKNLESAYAYCGIDISKDSFDYCIVDQNKHKLCQGHLLINLNSLEELKRIAVKDVKQNVIFLMESTAKYHRRVSTFLSTANFEVSVIQPLLIKRYNESKDLRNTKTDKKDAKIIAEYAADNHSNLDLYNSEHDKLRDLLRYYHVLVNEMTAMKNRYKEAMESIFPELLQIINIYTKTMLQFLRVCCTPKDICRKRASTLDKLLTNNKGKNVTLTGERVKELAQSSIGIYHNCTQLIVTNIIDRMIELMNHITEIENNIKALTDQEYGEEMHIVTSVNGIGNVLGTSFMVEIKDINLYSNWKKLSAYAGIDPGIAQSGSSINRKGHISKKGNKYLRSTLFLMASSVIKWSSRYKQYYNKKRQEGKSYKASIIAVANKLLKLLYSLLKSGMIYIEDYENNKSLRTGDTMNIVN